MYPHKQASKHSGCSKQSGAGNKNVNRYSTTNNNSISHHHYRFSTSEVFTPTPLVVFSPALLSHSQLERDIQASVYCMNDIIQGVSKKNLHATHQLHQLLYILLI